MPEPPRLLNPPMLPIPMKVDPPDPGKVTGAGAAVVVVVVVVEVVVVVCHKIDIVWIHEYFEDDEVFYRECDILIPAALEQAINIYNADKIKAKAPQNLFGFTHCRSSLRAGMLMKQKRKHRETILHSLTADPL